MCTICDRVKASFEVKDPTLKSLPIVGMFHRQTVWRNGSCKSAKRGFESTVSSLTDIIGNRFLCWIAMGYRMSRQASLAGYSPYFLLFGRWPIVGARVRDVLHTVVDLDSPQVWATVVEERARLFREEMPIAFNNLAIAQHRYMLRYAHKRSGDHTPKLRRFAAGDGVYLKRQKADSMDPRVDRLILRVVSVGSGGSLVLEGRDKK
ncbi:hypothetical protein KFL_008720010 [Klebsormidium nitens]|uniref:Uncharacterized protein n=1 Tax=Klebsormidium nitens TaxID=105231 RepID=A0A1Y1ISU6_KLENI|nr:hypothetical protein KFL_008720010 [Klebsormidium nitens]|eukprot:GAQ91866.1 hypothetical protein KFL_008720010 [Klebsormidium nitens]